MRAANRMEEETVMKKKALPVLGAMLACLILLCSACAGKASSESYDMSYAVEAPMAAEPSAHAESAAGDNGAFSSGQTALTSPQEQPSDADVRKIVYTADLTIVCDDPEAALSMLCARAAELGGYVAGSFTRNDDEGAYRCTATLKVPSASLDTLVNAAREAAGKVESYQLYSDDISLSYYDIAARLDSAKAEEKQLLAILEKCQTVEEILAVRESLARVRADVESYQGQINLWDNLVSYATLELTIRRTERTPVQGEKELIQLWKASDVWQKMSRGFVNSARVVVNALGAIGIVLACALIPAAVVAAIVLAIVFLCRLARKKRPERAARRAEKRAARKEARLQKKLSKKKE